MTERVRLVGYFLLTHLFLIICSLPSILKLCIFVVPGKRSTEHFRERGGLRPRATGVKHTTNRARPRLPLLSTEEL